MLCNARRRRWFFVKKIENLGAFSEKYFFSVKFKTKKKHWNGGIFYLGYSFEILKISLQSDFLEAQIICKCHMALMFCSMNSSQHKLHSENLFDMDKTCQKKKKFWMSLKSTILLKNFQMAEYSTNVWLR